MTRKIILGLGILLILIGMGVLGYKFYTDFTGRQQMEDLTRDFEEEIKVVEEAPPQGPVLGGSTIAILYFPKFEEKIAVTEAKGTDEYLGGVLSYSAGHVLNTAFPWDETGNVAIAAHNDTFFKNVHKLEKGDEIQVMTLYGTFKYNVANIVSVEPTDVEILNPTEAKQLTLITCNFSGAKRVVVFATGGEKI